MKPPFHLVPSRASPDTIRAIEALLGAAQRGEVIGLAYVAMFKNREYTASAAGEARRNPTFARGMVAALDDALAELVSR